MATGRSCLRDIYVEHLKEKASLSSDRRDRSRGRKRVATAEAADLYGVDAFRGIKKAVADLLPAHNILSGSSDKLAKEVLR